MKYGQEDRLAGQECYTGIFCCLVTSSLSTLQSHCPKPAQEKRRAPVHATQHRERLYQPEPGVSDTGEEDDLLGLSPAELETPTPPTDHDNCEEEQPQCLEDELVLEDERNYLAMKAILPQGTILHVTRKQNRNSYQNRWNQRKTYLTLFIIDIHQMSCAMISLEIQVIILVMH